MTRRIESYALGLEAYNIALQKNPRDDYLILN